MQFAILFGLLTIFTLTTAKNIDPPRKVRNVQSNSITRAVEKFTVNLYQEESLNDPGNLISSPLSTNIALTMLAYGSGGRTEEELKNVLGISTGIHTKNWFRSVIDDLNSLKDVKIEVLSKLFANKDIEVSPEYKRVTRDGFGTISTSLDFSKNEEAAENINYWIRNASNNKIKNIIESNAINAYTQMVLTSVIYFKGNWKYMFDTLMTKNETFYGETKNYTVQMMSQEEYLKYKKFDDLGASYIELPYEGKNVSMVIILPDEGNSLENVERKLATVNLQDLRKQIPWETNMDLRLPKFKVENSIDMKNILKKMGLRSMFDSSANFNKISPNGNTYVSKFMQKAYIEVSEEGTEAVAADIGIIIPYMGRDDPVKLHVNRPFHYKIIKHLDDDDALILFSGKVKNFEE